MCFLPFCPQCAGLPEAGAGDGPESRNPFRPSLHETRVSPQSPRAPYTPLSLCLSVRQPAYANRKQANTCAPRITQKLLTHWQLSFPHRGTNRQMDAGRQAGRHARFPLPHTHAGKYARTHARMHAPTPTAPHIKTADTLATSFPYRGTNRRMQARMHPLPRTQARTHPHPLSG